MPLSGLRPRMHVTIEKLRGASLDGLRELVVESRQTGFRALQRLSEEWSAGTNRFDKPGEALFIATFGGQVVGLCGLNVDPYTPQPRVGRVRHLYVRIEARRKGIGRTLLDTVITEARKWFDLLRLRTDDEGAARFYERRGFRPCFSDACTHVFDLRKFA